MEKSQYHAQRESTALAAAEVTQEWPFRPALPRNLSPKIPRNINLEGGEGDEISRFSLTGNGSNMGPFSTLQHALFRSETERVSGVVLRSFTERPRSSEILALSVLGIPSTTRAVWQTADMTSRGIGSSTYHDRDIPLCDHLLRCLIFVETQILQSQSWSRKRLWESHAMPDDYEADPILFIRSFDKSHRNLSWAFLAVCLMAISCINVYLCFLCFIQLRPFQFVIRASLVDTSLCGQELVLDGNPITDIRHITWRSNRLVWAAWKRATWHGTVWQMTCCGCHLFMYI